MVERRIQILPPQLVNKIAAGEVVERPASVVKELVENALDAGATKIEIFAEAGGRNIRVADNGCGMSPEDAQLAFYNHATSKIQEDSDLSRIETLGFRGEALASISSIAKVTCLTRTADAIVGSRVTFQENGEPTLTEAGCAPGTVMEIDDLFYNTPARLKFLKRPQTELGHIEEVVQYLALSHPEVQFSLSLNGKQVLKTRGSGELKSALDEVFHLTKQEFQDLIAIKQEGPGGEMVVAGYMSPPGQLKSSKRWMATFVNGRSVRCAILAKAITAGYESMIPSDKYPLCVLFLNMDVEEVDVNVHPTKKEVRYTNPNSVFSFIRQSLKNTLEANGHLAFVPVGQGGEGAVHYSNTFQPQNRNFMSLPSRGGSGGGFSGIQMSSSGFQPRDPRESGAALNFYEPVMSNGEESLQPTSTSELAPGMSWRVVGQLFNTYILLETRQGLMVVDQHIASERTFFEAFTQGTFAQESDVQQVMAIQPMTLSSTQVVLLSENREAFAKLGFSYILSETEQTVTLTTLPIIYQDRQPEGLFESLLTQLEETGEMQLKLQDMIATLSCHSAVRAGDPLSQDEMNKVIQGWLACRLPWTCPHGRPIAHTIRTEELNHFFHRPSLPVNAMV